ncbi:MAG: hypothetical protein K5930_13710 [Treponemataceae bacterium]|nr:hypothetical protein [Treponemataceae bacterium]
MKKFLVVLLLISVCAAGIFAQDFELPDGQWSWVDEKWNAEWVFDFDNMEVILKDLTKGNVVYTFTEDNITDFDYDVLDGGANLSIWCKCPDTYRAYKFTSRLDLDLEMIIDPDWTDDQYKTTLKLK